MWFYRVLLHQLGVDFLSRGIGVRENEGILGLCQWNINWTIQAIHFLGRQKVQEDLWRCLLWSINICSYLPKQCVQRKIENIKLGRDRRAHNAAEVVGNRRDAFFCQLCSFIIQQKLLLIAKPFVWTIDMMQAGTRGTLRLWVVMDFA